jgi:hypothetical protein
MPGEVGSCGRRDVRRVCALLCQGPLLLIHETTELGGSTSVVGERERDSEKQKSWPAE